MKNKGLFGHQVQTTIFIFQTHLHTFQHTFSPTRISKNFKKLQTTILKLTHQTGPKSFIIWGVRDENE